MNQLSQIHALLEFTGWVQKSPFTISQLVMIVQGRESSFVKYKNDLNTATAALLEIQKSDEADKKALLKAYLQKAFNLTSDQLEEEFLPHFITVDIDGPGIAAALNATFTNNQPDNPADLEDLVLLMRELERMDLLFKNLRFEAEAVTFLINNKDVFGIADLKNLDQNDIKHLAYYKSLADANKEMENKVRDSLRQYLSNGNFSSENIKVFSDLWKQPQILLQSIADSFAFAPHPLDAVQYLQEIQQVCARLGIEGHSLVKLKATDYQGLSTARDIIVGSFSSRYKDEKVRQEKLEPYRDKMNTLKRDALCHYILARKDTLKFHNRRDLYNFFLLDVEMSGCFRTSKVVAAISSLQLYIHRCLINLEQSDENLDQNIVDEWEWRKNYRVWEANRKVFLYPENYIFPELRGNKTHLFKELENELLQEKITEESSEAAYKKYLAQFTELANLRYAGAYYYKAPKNLLQLILTDMKEESKPVVGFASVDTSMMKLESDDGIFYLFARTNVQPYQYYYRTLTYEPSKEKKIWGNWIKIELAIEAKEISPIIHRGKLYIYWTEVQNKEINKVEDANSQAKGINFTLFVKYSFLDEKGKWSTPQRMKVGYTHSTEAEVYSRALGYFPYGEDEEGNELEDIKDIRDRMHDCVFEKYQDEVFRKPYAVISGNQKAPISIYYIWSQEQGVKVDEYTSISIPLSVGPVDHPVTFILPQVTFSVTNDQFKQATIRGIPIPYKASEVEKFDGLEVKAEIEGTFTLLSSAHCLFKYKLTLTSIVTAGEGSLGPITAVYQEQISPLIPVIGQNIPSNIFASKFESSLAKNEILNKTASDLKDGDKNISDPSVSFLQKEYSMVLSSGEDNYNRYVENGYTGFTNSGNFLCHCSEGVGFLLIKKTKDQFDSVMLTTILTDDLSDILFAEGIAKFLSLQTQLLSNGTQLDFTGPYGVYYWEMFFHIPFLIASHLNANQKFKEAKWWYERIFNPTSRETPSDTLPTDHNWQFREFRNLDIEKLKDILINDDAIEAYKEDPFNPHAIARLRLNAYQKAIVMKYIDNLLDWGDHLFAQDTRESINEAGMLYQLASDILGERPVKLGECEIAKDYQLTYETIGPNIGKGSEFLIMLEHIALAMQNDMLYEIKPMTLTKIVQKFLVNEDYKELQVQDVEKIAKATATKRISDNFFQTALSSSSDLVMSETSNFARNGKSYKVISYSQKRNVKNASRAGQLNWVDPENFSIDKFERTPTKGHPGLDMAKQGLMVFCVPPNEDLMVFCVPPNEDLLRYWDRVEDRLFKIRHCMNISGVRRSLALFQPPIDPMMLVRARAAGLSMEDITALLAESNITPTYRFSVCLEKAKQFTQTVQGFGDALLIALEKKDVEELTNLRTVHEQNILQLTKRIKEKQVEETDFQYQALEKTRDNVENRKNYYTDLINEGLTGWEIMEQVSKHVATGIKIAESSVHLSAGICYLILGVGCPFAMKYGGEELGHSGAEFALWTSSMAAIANEISASCALEARFQRREEEWKHQKELAETELEQIEKQLLAADIRKQVAKKDLAQHEKSMEHAEEIRDFYENKFTNFSRSQRIIE